MEKKIYSATITVDKERAAFIESRLDNAQEFIEDSLDNGTEEYEIEDLFEDIREEFTATFEDGAEVTIAVCPANPPYVDGTVFGQGFRIDCEPSETLIGKWIFQNKGTKYVVDLIKGE